MKNLGRLIFTIFIAGSIFTSCSLGSSSCVNGHKALERSGVYVLSIDDYHRFAFKMISYVPLNQKNFIIAPYGIFNLISAIHAQGDTALFGKTDRLLNLYNPSSTIFEDMGFLGNQIYKSGSKMKIFSYRSLIYHNNQIQYKRNKNSKGNLDYGDYLCTLKGGSNNEILRDQLEASYMNFQPNFSTDSLPNDIVEDGNSLILFSQLYTELLWDEAFDTTFIEDFFSTANPFENRNLKFLSKLDSFYYFKNTIMRIIEIPCADNALSLLLILPHYQNEFNDVRKSLNFDNYTFYSKMKHTKERVFVRFPYFNLSNRVYPETYLKKMGLNSILADSINIPGMRSKAPVHISRIYQHVGIKVSHEGKKPTKPFKGPPLDGNTLYFNANYPFIFILRETESNAIILMGHVFDPKQN